MTDLTFPNLSAPFENTCFRESTFKVANQQKQSHIIVSTSKPYSGQGLPYDCACQTAQEASPTSATGLHFT